MVDDLLIYGSYGYTGRLVARHAVESGQTPVIAGRDAEQLEQQATRLGLDHRTFTLDHTPVVERHVGGFEAVLNCAGPFTETASPMISACLETGTDYLDIAGTLDVLEAVAERDREAEKADITLLPAVGFNVVPPDCLAVYLDEKVDDARRLRFAIDGARTFSAGAIKSILDTVSRPGAIREAGNVRTVPLAWQSREVDFGDGPKPVMSVPWAPISSAYYSTGVENIEAYAAAPRVAIDALRRARPAIPVLDAWPVKRALKGAVDKLVSGPSARRRAKSVIRIWGEVTGDADNRATAVLQTPDPYDITPQTAVEAARRTVEDDVNAGFQTPGTAFGPDFVLDFGGVERRDVAEPLEATSAGMAGERDETF